MEIEFPFRPTFEPELRRAAVEAYVAGEALCDAGEHAAGIKKLKEACRIGWELSWERWPSWAEALHAELTGAAPAAEAASVRNHLFDATQWAPEVAALPREPVDSWWAQEAAVQTIAAELHRHNAIVLDGFAGESLAARARGEALVVQPARAGRPRLGRRAARVGVGRRATLRRSAAAAGGGGAHLENASIIACP